MTSQHTQMEVEDKLSMLFEGMSLVQSNFNGSNIFWTMESVLNIGSSSHWLNYTVIGG